MKKIKNSKKKSLRKTTKQKAEEFDAKMAAYEKEAERRSAWGAYISYMDSIKGTNEGRILIG